MKYSIYVKNYLKREILRNHNNFRDEHTHTHTHIYTHAGKTPIHIK